MQPFPGSYPILRCDEARALESRVLGGDATREWAAMQQAGRAIALAILEDCGEMGGLPEDGRLLVLAGKGHNGGDALIAAQALLARLPAAKVEVLFVFGLPELRPLADRAWRQLISAWPGRVRVITRLDPGTPYALCLDGIFGFQFRAPAEPRVAELIAAANVLPVRLRAAVDLPSAGLFRADFTYATGSVKTPVVGAAEAGRIRFLDLGFFDRETAAEDPAWAQADRVLTCEILAPLAALRPAQSDKRTFGHVFILGGSRSYPGAVLMSVLAALQSGAGLVTAFVPESLVPAFAARAPEAMWVGWPETPAGHLALEGEHLLRERLGRATALVAGPGLGREAETLALIRSVVAQSAVPLVLDADALQPEIVATGTAPRIVTPHAGEYARIKAALVNTPAVTLVLKGPATRLQPAADHAGGPAYYSFFGGPVLARGGSGDILAGLTGGLLAQTPVEPFSAAARAVVWHGAAADRLARSRGQLAVRTTGVLDYLPAALGMPGDGR
jgi:NAD(P)H-hydrate epimerase